MAEKIGMRYARTKANFASVKSTKKLPAPFYKQGHAHACAVCNTYIRTCSCSTPHEDPLCSLCADERDLSFWPADALPKDCCRAYSEVMTRDAKNRFMLAGLRDWWECKLCHRKFGFDPRDPKDDPPITMDEWRAKYEGGQ